MDIKALAMGVTFAVQPGDRVAYGSAAGTYAEEVVIEAKSVVRLPEGTYHVVSTYGDSNAIMRADLKVEVGKFLDTVRAA